MSYSKHTAILVVYLIFRKVLGGVYNHCLSFINQCSEAPKWLIWNLDPCSPPSPPPRPVPSVNWFFREHGLYTLFVIPSQMASALSFMLEFITVAFVTYRKQEHWNTQCHSHPSSETDIFVSSLRKSLISKQSLELCLSKNLLFSFTVDTPSIKLLTILFRQLH